MTFFFPLSSNANNSSQKSAPVLAKRKDMKVAASAPLMSSPSLSVKCEIDGMELGELALQ